ncbi:MAG: hypothetical protein AB1483_09240 [Candidatus Zixiibacteriota bacterium]
MNKEQDRNTELELLAQVDELNETVKTLALNLAIYLAKAKAHSDDLNRMEPEFIRLINGSVKVVQELATVIAAARNKVTMAFDVPSVSGVDHIERKLESILRQCHEIMSTLAKETDIKI